MNTLRILECGGSTVVLVCGYGYLESNWSQCFCHLGDVYIPDVGRIAEGRFASQTGYSHDDLAWEVELDINACSTVRL